MPSQCLGQDISRSKPQATRHSDHTTSRGVSSDPSSETEVSLHAACAGTTGTATSARTSRASRTSTPSTCGPWACASRRAPHPPTSASCTASAAWRLLPSRPLPSCRTGIASTSSRLSRYASMDSPLISCNEPNAVSAVIAVRYSRFHRSPCNVRLCDHADIICRSRRKMHDVESRL